MDKKLHDVLQLVAIDNLTVSNDRSKNYNLHQSDIYQIFAYLKKYNCKNGILLYPKYDEEIAKTFKFDDEIKIHILDFASQFVTYNIANIVRFKSKYTISFYERFKLQTQFKKEPMITETITLAELKNILNLQNKYKRTNDFKHKVLEVAKNDMQRYSDVYMNYEYIKKGKTIHSIKFFLQKTTQKHNKLSLQMMNLRQHTTNISISNTKIKIAIYAQ